MNTTADPCIDCATRDECTDRAGCPAYQQWDTAQRKGVRTIGAIQLDLEKLCHDLDGGELSDLVLAENILSYGREKKRFADAQKRCIEALGKRLIKAGFRGDNAEEVGEGETAMLLSGDFKKLSDWDLNVLVAIDKCTTEEQVRRVLKQVPSGKQLKALSEEAGASAKAVIESARRRNETDTIVVKIKKPRKKKVGGGRGRGRGRH